MTAQILRVINSQTIVRSILLDKIDESQGNTPGYASKPKMKIYVPYVNPVDPTVPGYVDLIPTNNVLLANSTGGVISGMAAHGRVSVANITSASVKTSVVSGATHSGSSTTITGTTFTSISPDLTYVTLINLTGVSQKLSQNSISANQLADVIALANQLKTSLNAHELNTGGVWHSHADDLNAVAAANATDLATSITLLNQIKTKYEAHRVTLLNSGSTSVHGAADNTNTIVAANATDLSSAVTLANDLKAKFNAHRILTTASVHALADTINTVTLSVGDSISSTTITVSDSFVTIGTPTTGWKVQVQANSKKSNIFTL